MPALWDAAFRSGRVTEAYSPGSRKGANMRRAALIIKYIFFMIWAFALSLAIAGAISRLMSH